MILCFWLKIPKISYVYIICTCISIYIYIDIYIYYNTYTCTHVWSYVYASMFFVLKYSFMMFDVWTNLIYLGRQVGKKQKQKQAREFGQRKSESRPWACIFSWSGPVVLFLRGSWIWLTSFRQMFEMFRSHHPQVSRSNTWDFGIAGVATWLQPAIPWR